MISKKAECVRFLDGPGWREAAGGHSSASRFVERSAKLFDKGEGCHQIGEAPPIIVFAAPGFCASMPQLKLSRFVEFHDLVAQRNVQPNSRYRNINEVRVCSFVCQRLASHVYAPIPKNTVAPAMCRTRGFAGSYQQWRREAAGRGHSARVCQRQ